MRSLAKPLVTLGLLILVGWTTEATPPPPQLPGPEDVPVLVPLAPARAYGAFGTVWDGALVIHNQSDRAIMVLARSGILIAPKSTLRVRAEGRRGLLVYVKPEDLGELTFDSEIAEVSGLYESRALRIRPIPPAELLTTRSDILHVPADKDARVHLRVYDPSGREERMFHVRVFSPGGPDRPDELLTEFVLVTTDVPESVYEPGYAIVALDSLFGDVSSVRIEVEPADDGSPFWCFVSVAEDSTQDVHLFDPAAAIAPRQ